MERTNYNPTEEFKKKKPIKRDTNAPEPLGEVIFDATDKNNDDVVEIDEISLDEWEREQELRAAPADYNDTIQKELRIAAERKKELAKKPDNYDDIIANEKKIAAERQLGQDSERLQRLKVLDSQIRESLDDNNIANAGSQPLDSEEFKIEGRNIIQLRVKAGALRKEMGDIADQIAMLKKEPKLSKAIGWLKRKFNGETSQLKILETNFSFKQRELSKLQSAIEILVQREVDSKLQSPRRGIVSLGDRKAAVESNAFVARKVDSKKIKKLSTEGPTVEAEGAKIIQTIESNEQKITNDLSVFLSEFGSKFNITVDQNGNANFDNFDLNRYFLAYNMIADKSNKYEEEIDRLDSQDLSIGRKDKKYSALTKALRTLFKISSQLTNYRRSGAEKVKEKAA